VPVGSQESRKEHFIGYAGLRLAAEAAGPEDGPPVILSHGGGQTRHAWGKGLRDCAAAGYRTLSLDLRGHGESQWAPGGDYSPDALVGDLAAVARAVGGKPALVGASLGGTASLIVAGEQPDLASSLVLVDVTPALNMEGVERIHGFMSAYTDGFASLEAAADAIAAYMPERPRAANLDGIRKNLRAGDDGRWYWHWDPAFIAGDLEQTVAALTARMSDAARRVTQPTLLVRGVLSDVVSHDAVDDLRARIPHLEFVDVADAGHMVAGDKNDAFTAAILDFLRRHAPTARPSS
jgi:pimeloyl-ACP methyl ester carboxylesterase